ncbi:MAG TPA: hypothetical protein PK575_05630 [Syntrophorhabdus sp.]|nr:MAG: hypothetical protein A4E59_02799 [Syntrophorhabdus sp. PtaB.Bin027]OQB77550.1 MAG: hypothetical protein BWX92_00848 [Deltaproteobacteria bacterium ADurb.Bin135]HNY69181.1 hypothetical protein [Syntrophorhabdus sp.]HQI96188.1 hypothetical protein [Syntrophorhabdus sp.]
MKTCYKCQHPVMLEFISRRDECQVCGSDLHVCLNCSFFDETKSNKCREPQAEYVKEKDRSNYCDFFRFRDDVQKKSGKEEAKKLWDELFKKV